MDVNRYLGDIVGAWADVYRADWISMYQAQPTPPILQKINYELRRSCEVLGLRGRISGESLGCRWARVPHSEV